MIVVVVLSFLFRAPLEAPANPAETPNPAKAPWYFLWLQEIVTISTIKIGSFTINGALIGGILLPGLLMGLAVWWPYRGPFWAEHGRGVACSWSERNRTWFSSPSV